MGLRVRVGSWFGPLPRNGGRCWKSRPACLKEQGRVNICEVALCSRRSFSPLPLRPVRGRGERRSPGGSRWSACSLAKTNDVEAAAPRHAELFWLSMASWGRWVRPPGSLATGERLLQQARLLRHVLAEVDRHGGLRPPTGDFNHFFRLRHRGDGSHAGYHPARRSGACEGTPS